MGPTVRRCEDSPAEAGAGGAIAHPVAGPAVASGSPPQRCELAVVGGGIVGLAVARELARRHPRSSLCVLEREGELGTHQSARNSGVIHAGIYYTPGSLKARLCVQGARELYEYCEANAIEHERAGKLVIATAPRELAALEQLERRARANGVRDVRLVDAAGIEAIEPHARGLAALHSPHTGIVDFSAVCRSYARDVLDRGGSIATSCAVRAVSSGRGVLALSHTRGVTEARHAVFCAGAWADRLAVGAGADRDPRIVPFRGAYARLVPSRRELVRGLIYPLPDPSLPFLGVHLTRRLDGGVLLGPGALIAGARDGYRLGAVRGADVLETLSWPGTWRLLRSSWRSAVSELRTSLSRSSLARQCARFVPELQADDVEAAFAGVRAQALSRDGRLLDDFAFSHTERALHVRNAPSPAATSSLAIARHVAEELERAIR